MATILGSLNERAHLGIDVADRAVHDEKRLVDVGAYSPSGERRLGDHVELRPHSVAVDLELRRRAGLDDPELQATIQAAPQVVSGKPGLDAHLDPDAAGRERDLVTVVAGQRVDVGLRRRDAVLVGHCHSIARLLLIALRAMHRRQALDALDDGAGRQRTTGAHGDQRGALVGALELVQRGRDQPAAGATHRVPECDRAAVDVDLVHVRVVHPRPGQHHGGECLVDLGDVDIAHLHAGLLEHLRRRLHWAVEVVVRLGADERLADDAGPRLQPERLGFVFVHPQHGGGAVGDLRRRTRGVDPALDDRLELAQALQRGVAQTLVLGDDVSVAGRLLVLVEHWGLDAADLTVEAAFGPGLLGLALRVEPELVDLLAGDAAALGDPRGGGELIGQVDVPRGRAQDAAIRSGVGAQADAAHRLDATRDPDVNGPRGNQAGDEAVGLLAATALAVHGHGAHLLGQPGDEPPDAGDVVGLLAVLRHAAADDLFDVTRVDAGFLHERLLRGAQQLGGVQS